MDSDPRWICGGCRDSPAMGKRHSEALQVRRGLSRVQAIESSRSIESTGDLAMGLEIAQLGQSETRSTETGRLHTASNRAMEPPIRGKSRLGKNVRISSGLLWISSDAESRVFQTSIASRGHLKYIERKIDHAIEHLHRSLSSSRRRIATIVDPAS